jgi:NADH:ubiquinone oxidoreductase subunit 6 (subunit J)
MFTMTTLFYIFATFALLSATMVIRAKNPVYSVLFLILVFCNAAGLLLLIDLDFFAMVFLVVYVGAIAVLFLFVVMMLNIKYTEINENILRYLPVGGIFGLLFLLEVMLIVEQDIVPVLAYHTQSALPFMEWLSCTITFFVVTSCISLWYGSILFSDVYLDTHQRCTEYSTLTRTLETFDTNAEQCMLAHVDYVTWPAFRQMATTIEALGMVVYTYYMSFFIVASLILLIAMIGAIVLTMHKGVYVKRQEVFDQNTRDFSKTLLKIKKTKK